MHPVKSLPFSVINVDENERIISELMTGLAYIHSKEVCDQFPINLFNQPIIKIIHRDIKPSNIFLRDNNHVVIGDFGLACSAVEGDHTTVKGSQGWLFN